MKLLTHPFLGPAPCWKGFLKWGLCVFVTTGAWHLYKTFPMAGLVAIGLTPFLCLFLFFRGLAQISRTVPYVRTIFRARSMRMSPAWGSASGGFLLTDPVSGLWASDKSGGSFQAITRLHLHTDGEAHCLEIFMQDEHTPAASVGVGNPAQLDSISDRLQKDIKAVTGHAVPLTHSKNHSQNLPL